MRERRSRPRPEQTAEYIAATQAIYDEWVRRQPPLTPGQRLVARSIRQRLGMMSKDEVLSAEDAQAIRQKRFDDELASIQTELDMAAEWQRQRQGRTSEP